jgi:hypothetical protein
VGIGSFVTEIAICVAPGGGDAPSSGDWTIENSGLSVTDSSSQITITSASTVGDPFGESSPSTLNVVCSMGQIQINNHDTSTGYYLYFSDPTAASSPGDPVEIGSAPTTTVGTLATAIVPSEASMGFLTTMSDSSTVVAKFIIRHTDTGVVILEELEDSSSGQTFGRAIPAIIEASASNNKLYVVNISHSLATASVSGFDQSFQPQINNFTVAPHGGVYVVDVSMFSDEHQVWLNWDVAGDPKMVVMRPLGRPRRSLLEPPNPMLRGLAWPSARGH